MIRLFHTIKRDKDLNTGFYADLDTNFEQALILSEHEFSHAELLELLKNGNIPEKQIAALRFDKVTNSEDAAVLMSNLTGCDGKIREAVALRINQIITSTPESAQFFMNPLKFADAVIDINANICRFVADTVKFLKFDEAFSREYTARILTFTNEALDALDKFIFRDKKYVINKQLFKLYWCLETLKDFYEFVPDNILESLLSRCAEESEYTIREKTADILVLSAKFPKLSEKLMNDENYYVRAAFLNH